MANKRYDDSRNWYAVTTLAGYEDKVAENLRQRIEGVDMADKIFDTLVPKEKQIEVRNGKRKVVERKILQSYVLVEMKLTEETWFLKKKCAIFADEWVPKNQCLKLTFLKAKLSILLMDHSKVSKVQFLRLTL